MAVSDYINAIIDFEPLTREQRIALRLFLTDFVTEHKLTRFEEVLSKRTRYLTIVLEEIFQPHNASACIRSADCFGVQDVHIIEGINPYRVNKDIALGAAKWLTLQHHGTPGETNTAQCLRQLKSEGYRIVATTLREGSIPLEELKLDQKTALCFGTEETGLSDVAHELADELVYIPMAGFTQSYNISVSVALCLYELTRQLHQSSLPWQLSADEKNDLTLEWLISVATRSDALVRHFQRENGLEHLTLVEYEEEPESET